MQEDDAASFLLGEEWHVPSYEEWKELANVNNCSWEWVYNNGESLINPESGGFRVTSKITNNSIYLPAAGVDWGINLGTEGRYWASSIVSHKPAYACHLSFRKDNSSITTEYASQRCGGNSIRAVKR